MSDMPVNSATRGQRFSPDAPDPGPRTDRELLGRFVAQRDEGAFAALVERHGPMVLDVCRRVLRDSHEAEDACQATFLVLARKARSLRRPELLANWLYGVAYRAARKTQRQAATYRARAVRGATMQATGDTTPDVIWQDLRPVLDAELGCLSPKYRTVVVLCYLEGLKVEEAAEQLGCPRGTVLSRLARARELLRSRLAKRGLTLTAGFLGLLLARKAVASTAMPPAFVHSTAHAACRFATRGGAVHLPISKRAVETAKSVLLAMFLAKFKVVMVCILTVALALGAGGLVALRLGIPADKGNQLAAGNGAQREQASKSDKERLQGAWREVAFENANAPLDPNLLKTMSWRISGDAFIMADDNMGPMNGADGNPVRFEFRLDPDARPKRIDVSINGQPVWAGIYEMTDDTLEICTVDGGRPRPTEIAPKGPNTVWKFERIPADKVPPLPEKP